MNDSTLSLRLKLSPAVFLLFSLFLIAPFYKPENLGGSGLLVPSNIAVWLAVVAFIGYTFAVLLKSKDIQLPQYHRLIFAVPVLITLTGFIAGIDNPISWLFKITAIWAGYCFFIAVLQVDLNRFRGLLLFAILVSAVIHAWLGFIQVWMPDLLTGLFSRNSSPEGLFQQINNQASYQVSALAIALFLARTRFYNESSYARFKFLVAGLAVVSASLLVGMSGSRIGLLTIVLVLAIQLFLMLKSRRLALSKSNILLVLCLLALFSGLSLGGSKAVAKASHTASAGYTGEMRISLYQISANLIKEKPIFGHGLGSFPRVFQPAKVEYIEAHPDAYIINRAVEHPHNELLQWFVEGGIVAFLALMLLILVTLAKLWQQNMRGGLLLACLLPIVVHTQVEVPMYTSGIHYFLFLFLLAIVFSEGLTMRRVSLSSAGLVMARGTNLLIAVLACVFLVHTAIASRELTAFVKNNQPQNLQLLNSALTNPYLAMEARRLYMRNLLYMAIKTNQDETIKEVLAWTEEEIKSLAAPELFYRLINGYEELEMRAEACRAASNGKRLFPRDPVITRFINECEGK